jgi:acyl-CoA hydrolase
MLLPYVDERYKSNFRLNSFFIGDTTRDTVNRGEADYTPVFLSRLPDLFDRKVVPIDVALIQTSLPDEHGYLNLGVSVDIVKSAVENADLIIAQLNSNMPCVHGDGFVHVDDIDYVSPMMNLCRNNDPTEDSEVAAQIGNMSPAWFRTVTPFKLATEAFLMRFYPTCQAKNTWVSILSC